MPPSSTLMVRATSTSEMSVCFCQLHRFVFLKNAVFVFRMLIILCYLEGRSSMISQNIGMYLSNSMEQKQKRIVLTSVP
jgi:hypothetical protein